MTPFEWFIAFLMGGIATLVALFKTYYMPKEPDTEVDHIAPPTPEIKPTEPIKPPLSLQIYQEARKWLGKEASPKDLAADEYGCAESVSNIINIVLPDFFAGILSTIVLNEILSEDSRFHTELNIQAGDIIVSPRIGEQAGHCGIAMSDTKIASNNSSTGLFETNYSWQSWIKEMKDRRGLHTYIYRAR